MSKDVYKVGLIGCGTISDAYIRGLGAFPWLELIALSDIDVTRAEAKARQYNISKGYYGRRPVSRRRRWTSPST